ncbi:hypothetical protein BPAE_0129g00140 [Botrytis paeoniae]|uniref:Up-regulated during septation protein 1 domain-containing protein n=1 Tax=Botrytis paeoniae TaxID=278948 RepID=A0A4Z1FJ52_9HELO|nr:hypothetical protein BPAE_0129g00140 [Botrytis paeoniae]
MAHISEYLADATSSVGLNNLIAREMGVSSPQDIPSESPTMEEREKHIWRMHQPSEAPRKYSIFPSKEKLSIGSDRQSPESSLSLALGEKHNVQKPKELNKRRKPSVTELGPMTTVHEVSMDSPTIPGRPPLHERSFSAPGGKWRQHTYGESLVACIEGPILDENAEIENEINESKVLKRQRSNSNCRSKSPRSLSPKSLAPLYIPSRNAPMPPRIRTQSSPSTLRSPMPPQVPPKSARMMEQSPYHRSSPFTPSSSVSTSTAATTPSSPREGRSSPKPWMSTGRSSPKPWMNLLSGRSSPKPVKDASSIMQSANSSSVTLPLPTPRRNSPGHFRNQSETFVQQPRAGTLTHDVPRRRGGSESGPSIMDRGRPKKRSDGSPIKASAPKPLHSKRTPTSEEQLAFEHLPQGVKAAQASSKLTQSEMETLRCQAIGQVCRFEVLNSKDVDALSRELRALDERCLYLRRTHRSLRAGRRNLHDRICTYLRSPRTAKFSHDAILKQEEALSELDSSIDDWVSKLDQAENRRTRVRQKLLEHVAAAVFMPVTTPAVKKHNNSVNTITPPRSPIKGISPVRESHRTVDVMTPQPQLSEAELKEKKESRRKAVESIRIYADSDVFALLADVEDEINRMGDPTLSPSSDESHEKQVAAQPEAPRKEKATEASQADSRFSSSAPAAPMSPFLLRPMVFTMPAGKQGVKV